MNVLDAAHMTGHEYPGGTKALGVRMDMSPQILINKLNPHNKTHHLSLAEAMQMMRLSDDHRILFAAADELGYELKPLQAIGQQTPMQAVSHTIEEFGQLVSACSDALADGKVTLLEVRRVEKELSELISQASALAALLRQKAGNE